MTTTNKIIGTLSIASGILVLYVGYYAASGVAAIGGWVADKIDATGAAHTGVTLLAFVPLIGLICAIAASVIWLLAKGVMMIKR